MQSQRYARDQEHSTHVLRHLTLADPVPCNFDYCPPMSPGLAWPETSAIPLPADSLTPSYIVPSGLRKSKTPGPSVPPFWVRPPRGPNPTIRLAGEPALFHIMNSVTIVGFVGAD